MNKFDTHGGHFEPQGYMRVNAGGSHEENPNGGVQVGVDSEGTPNLLEEGEPVYNDYVYSDNISADADILKSHNLPPKYGGKLYSEIADTFVDEVAEIPLDPIANNGLNAMLVRLADAQEEQKAMQQRKELEDELSQMSPEELAELEQMLSEQEMVQQQENQEAVVPEMVLGQASPEQAAYQQQVPMVPGMAYGGEMQRLYWPGGTLLKKVGDSVSQAANSPVGQRVLQELGLAPMMVTLSDGSAVPVTGGAGAIAALATPTELAPIRGMRAAKNAKTVNDAMDKAYAIGEAAAKGSKAAKAAAETAAKASDSGKLGMKGWGRALYNPVWAVGRLWHDMPTKGFLPTAGKVALEAPVLAGNLAFTSAVPSAITAAIRSGVRTYDAHHNASTKADFKAAEADDPFKAYGGNLFRFGNPIESRTHYGSVQWPYSNAYNGFDEPTYDGTDETITPLSDDAVDPGVYQYLPLFTGLNANIPSWKSTLPTPIRKDHSQVVSTESVPPAASGDSRSRSAGKPSQKYPLYEMSDEELDAMDAYASRELRRGFLEQLPAVDNPYIPKSGRRDADGNVIMYGKPAERPVFAEMDPDRIPRELRAPTKPVKKNVSSAPENSDEMLPVWPRYAGAITSGLLGLYNAFQEPDRYNIPAYMPVLPEGRMHLIDPVYNPLDQNQLVNDVLTSGAGTTRAIGNSGLGASTQATLLAQDYNTGRNIGTALAQAREANNQRMNQVISQRNQNASTLGNFNYGQSRDRAQILNDAAIRNLQNDIMEQRLNYAAEGQKYAAIQNQIDAVAQALSGIGRENAVLNMINGDEAYAYAISRMFDPYYKGYVGASGGHIKRKKK